MKLDSNTDKTVKFQNSKGKKKTSRTCLRDKSLW